MVAAERHEVSLSGGVESFQSPRHEVSLRLRNAPLKPKDGLSGPPIVLIWEKKTRPLLTSVADHFDLRRIESVERATADAGEPHTQQRNSSQ